MVTVYEPEPPELPVELFFIAKNGLAADLLMDELNSWIGYGVEAYRTGEKGVRASADRSIIEEDDDMTLLDTVAERFGGYFDGYGTKMRG